jgi:hypothetical protein
MKYLLLLLAAMQIAAPRVAAQSNTTITATFDHRVGNTPLVLDQTEFNIWNGKKVRLTRAEFYVCWIDLIGADNEFLPLTGQYLLVNANAPAAVHSLGSWPIVAATGIRLNLGVDKPNNHADPAAWPAAHPLAPQNPSMHWGWQAGYRFMAIEGLIDNNGDGVPEADFEIHNVGDALLREVVLYGPMSVENGVLKVKFTLDYLKLFQNIALNNNAVYQHGDAPDNVTMMNNAAGLGFITLPATSGLSNRPADLPEVSAYPNPANMEVSLQYPTVLMPDQLTVWDVYGRIMTVRGDVSRQGKTSVETSSFPNGTYVAVLSSNGRAVAQARFVVTH